MNNLSKILEQYKRFFIVPMDHPLGEDTKQLAKIGVQGFVKKIDDLGHDGYIFHSREYLIKPIETNKDFFLTVGEAPDNYLADISELERFPKIKHLTVFYEVKDGKDEFGYEFYKDYVKELKKHGYYVMAMGFPAEEVENCDFYQHIADMAQRLGCDVLKTDLFADIGKLDLGRMKLCIGGGKWMEEVKFDQFIKEVAVLKTASCSFGRNIFEALNYRERIKKVLQVLGRIG